MSTFYSIKQVRGDGDIPCKIMVLGEAPGRYEDNKGVPFIHESGTELDKLYLPLAGLCRGDVHVDNVYQYRPYNEKGENVPPENYVIIQSRTEILNRIARVCPKFIIAVGSIPNKLLYGEEYDVRKQHGIPYPYKNTEHGIECIILPTYHPAAGIRTQRLIGAIMDDFTVFKEYIQGRVLPIHTRSAGHYTLINTTVELERALSCFHGAIGVDTETLPDQNNRPWTIQLSLQPGSAFAIMADREDLMCIINRWMWDKQPLWYVHNALFDFNIMDKIGIDIMEYVTAYPHKVFDTMSAAYYLQWPAKGLKVLAYRLLNIIMDSYDDIVAPANNRKALPYLNKVLGVPWDDPEPEVKWVKGQLTKSQPRNVIQIIQRQLWKYNGFPETHVTEHIVKEIRAYLRTKLGLKLKPKLGVDALVAMDTESGTASIIEALQVKFGQDHTIDLYKWWKKYKYNDAVETALGSMPAGNLSDITFSKALHYMCADADMTFRIGKIMGPLITAEGMLDIMTVDMGCVPMIISMMRTGFGINPTFFSDKSTDYKEEMICIQDEIDYKLGYHLSPNSPVDVLKYITRLKLRDIKGKMIRSTDADLLKPFKDRGIMGDILRYRELSKLNGTYAKKLPAMSQNERLCAQISISTAETGRLACYKPNCQTIPDVMREGFIPGDIEL